MCLAGPGSGTGKYHFVCMVPANTIYPYAGPAKYRHAGTRNANTPLKHWSQVLVKFEIKLEY